jgi:hypothetical protein
VVRDRRARRRRGGPVGPELPGTRALAAAVVPIEGDRLTYGFGTEPVIYRDGLELTQMELAARSECR